MGCRTWQDGDVAALEDLLDPNVELLWWEAGDWDCHNRDEVLHLLHERKRQAFARGAVELIDAGDNVLISVSRPIARPGWPRETATVIRFREGKAVHMQQFKAATKP